MPDPAVTLPHLSLSHHPGHCCSSASMHCAKLPPPSHDPRPNSRLSPRFCYPPRMSPLNINPIPDPSHLHYAYVASPSSPSVGFHLLLGVLSVCSMHLTSPIFKYSKSSLACSRSFTSWPQLPSPAFLPN